MYGTGGRSGKIGAMGQARYAFAWERVGDWVYAVGGGAADS